MSNNHKEISMDSTYYTTSSADSGAASIVSGILYLILALVAIVGFWKLFTKAGYAGWKILIPIYNIYIICKIADRPGWWTVLYLVPVVNLVVSAFVALDIAKAFGKSPVFALVGLWFFAPIGQVILAFDDSTYDKTRIERV
jgi:hypothetical protein